MRLTIGLSKKLGLPGYSSVGATCQLESSEFPGCLNAAEFHQRVARAFDACRDAVEAELRRHLPAAEDEQGFPEAPPAQPKPATPNQLQALRRLVAQTRHAPPDLGRLLDGKPIERLTASEASAAIGRLRRAPPPPTSSTKEAHELQ